MLLLRSSSIDRVDRITSARNPPLHCTLVPIAIQVRQNRDKIALWHKVQPSNVIFGWDWVQVFGIGLSIRESEGSFIFTSPLGTTI